MDQVIDEPDECVLSTDQLTLMRLWLLQAKYFPLLIFSHACLSPLLFPALSLPHIMRRKSLVIILVAGSSMCILQNGEIFTLWDLGRGGGWFGTVCELVASGDVPFPFMVEWSEDARVQMDLHTRKKKEETHVNTADAAIAAVPEGHSGSL